MWNTVLGLDSVSL